MAPRSALAPKVGSDMEERTGAGGVRGSREQRKEGLDRIDPGPLIPCRELVLGESTAHPIRWVTSHIYSQVAWCTRIQSPKLGRLSPIKGKAKLGRLSSIQGKTAGCRYMPNTRPRSQRESHGRKDWT